MLSDRRAGFIENCYVSAHWQFASVFVHGFAECFGLLAEVLLVDNAILVHDECHHTGGAVFGGISYEREACYSQELLLYFSWSSRSACNHSSK